MKGKRLIKIYSQHKNSSVEETYLFISTAFMRKSCEQKFV